MLEVGKVTVGSSFINSADNKVIICAVNKNRVYKVRSDSWPSHERYNLEHDDLVHRLRNKTYTNWCITKELYKIY